MRKQLSKYKDQYQNYYGTFKEYGWRPVLNSFGKVNHHHIFKKRTVLLTNIYMDRSGENLPPLFVADHQWFSDRCFQTFNVNNELYKFNKGDKISFLAVAKLYVKGYYGKDEGSKYSHPLKNDYNLSDVSNLKLTEKSKENDIHTGD